jgi:hypothetical protein
MIFATTTPSGEPVYTARVADLNAVATWARALCHLVFGPERGERHYRRLPARAVLSLWATRL